MMRRDETLKWLTIMGIAGGIFWYLFARYQEHFVSKTTSSIWSALFPSQEPEPYQAPKDSHGCVTGLENWCESLGHCVVKGLTCPSSLTPAPLVYPVRPDCESGFYYAGASQGCIRIPGTEPVEPLPYVPNQTDKCYGPRGDPLTVPPGMDCGEAVADMCRRFGPGSKWCS